MHAGRMLIEMGNITERAQARDLLEEGLQPGIRLAFGSITDLIDIYNSIGPIEKAKELLDKYGDRIREAYDADQLAGVEAKLAAEIETHVDLKVDGGRKRFKRAQYPTKEAFNGPLYELFVRDVASDFNAEAARFSRSDYILTIGSCFARRIASAMREQGINATCYSLAETVNTTYANRDFFGFIAGNKGKNDQFWESELSDRSEKSRKGNIIRVVEKSSIIVYTLGVAPAFFNRDSGAFTPHSADSFKTRSFLKDNVYRMTTVEENVENLSYIFENLNSLNPDFRLVLTVSPVPLRATFESGSAIVSDCESKSTLRVAATQFARMHPGRVVYWPSFEMVKWVSPHREPFYGTDDGFSIHISDEVVSTIVKAFLGLCLVD